MSCATSALLHRIGDRWSLSILHVLQAGPLRFLALSESLEGISSRTLSDRLKALGDLGLVSREVFAEVPPRVEYSLTPKARTLEDVFTALARVSPGILARRRGSTSGPGLESTSCPTCSEVRPADARRRRTPSAEGPAVALPEPAPPIATDRPYFPPVPLTDVTLL